MWACHSQALPGYVWTSSEDASDFMPGWECVALEEPLPGSSWTQWATSWKIVKLIEGWPF
jgi:hypothetical protein